MSLTAQRITDDEWYMRVSDGRSVTIDKPRVIAAYQSTSGNRETRISNTISILLAYVEAEIGYRPDIDLLFDENSGRVLECTHYHGGRD